MEGQTVGLLFFPSSATHDATLIRAAAPPDQSQPPKYPPTTNVGAAVGSPGGPWIALPVTAEDIAWAHARRAERDQHHGNLYPEASTDTRWVGDLGERLGDAWLRDVATLPVRWVQRAPTGQPDFFVGRTAIGWKTVKRQGPPAPHYTAQISAVHRHEPVDYFFFCSYEAPQHVLWLLGGIERPRFLYYARRYEAGAVVHPHYQVRVTHAILNAPIDKLTAPRRWLHDVERHGGWLHQKGRDGKHG